jgi:nucleotide-binding universal stress UspA family protein
MVLNEDQRDTDIVVGVDGSPSSQAALRWAVSQARRTGGRVQAVAAWETPAGFGWAPVVPYEDHALTAGKILNEAVHEAFDGAELDVTVVERVVPGHPAQVLIDLSAHAELLVVGCRGHGAFAGTLLGSVSHHCVHHARCPVVVVRGKC